FVISTDPRDHDATSAERRGACCDCPLQDGGVSAGPQIHREKAGVLVYVDDIDFVAMARVTVNEAVDEKLNLDRVRRRRLERLTVPVEAIEARNVRERAQGLDRREGRRGSADDEISVGADILLEPREGEILRCRRARPWAPRSHQTDRKSTRLN